MNIKLDQKDVALTKATTSFSKPVLNNMCVKDGKLITADGFMLVMRDANCDNNEQEVLIPAKIINSLKVNSNRIADINADKDTIEVNFIDNKGNIKPDEYTATYKTYATGVFPDVEALYKNTNKKAEIALNVSLLKRLLSCLPNSGTLRLKISELTNPVEFNCYVGDERPIYGLLMPMYVEWDDFKWHSETINKEVK